MVIKKFKLKTGQTLTDEYVCKLIKAAHEDWENISHQIVGKSKLLDYWLDCLEEANKIKDRKDRIFSKSKILVEIGKLEKHYETQIRNKFDLSDVGKDDIDRLLKGMNDGSPN